MRVDQFRVGLSKLANALDELKARDAATDLQLLNDFLSTFDDQTVAACLNGIRRRLEEKPAPPKKAVAANDTTLVADYAARLGSVRNSETALRSALAAIDADKKMKLPELKAVAQSLGVPTTSKSRPKAMQELTTALLRGILEQHRLDLVGRST